MRPLRLISLNTYLISSQFNKNRQTEPEVRAARIRNNLLLAEKRRSSDDNDSNNNDNENHYYDDDDTTASADTSKIVRGRQTTTKIINGTINNKPDLCFFQEVWGSGFQELLQPPILEHYNVKYQPLFRSYDNTSTTTTTSSSSSSPWRWWENSVNEICDSLYLRYHKTGGLFDLASTCATTALLPKKNNSNCNNNSDDDDDDDKPSSGSIQCNYRSKHTFTKSRSKSLKGVEATMWKIPTSIWKSNDKDKHSFNNEEEYYYSLLVFNTHLDPSSINREYREHQIKEIIQFMEDTFHEIDKQQQEEVDQSITSNSTTSTNSFGSCSNSTVSSSKDSSNNDDNNNIDWRSRTGVLLVGDFNVKANSKEYHEILLPLLLQRQQQGQEEEEGEWEDFFHNDNNNNDNETTTTIEETYSRTNSLACHPDDYGRIDYIFGVTKFASATKIAAIASSRPSSSVSSDDGRGINKSSSTTIQKQQQQQRRRRRRQQSFLPLKCHQKAILQPPVGEELSDHYALFIELVPKD